MTMCDPQNLERRINLAVKNVNLWIRQRTAVGILTDTTLAPYDGTIIIGTAAANVADVILPKASLFPGREITIVNLSGAIQAVSSYNATDLEIKQTSGAAVSTFSLENSSSVSTGRRTFKSYNSQWVLTSI